MPAYSCEGGDCENGQGSLHLNNVLLYNGEFRDGQPDGQGRSYFVNGKVHYEGEWRYGKFDGSGTDYREDGKIAFEGGWRNGMPDGQGIFYDRDGKIAFEGGWLNGRPDVQIDVSRSSAFSQALNHSQRLKRDYSCESGNCEDGQGTVLAENVILYRGEWRDGKPDGQGSSYYADGDVSYEGEWREGLAHGRGTRHVASGRHDGEWRKGLAHGHGIFYSNNGRILFKGNFLEGKPDGQGSQYFDRTETMIGPIKYEGKWHEGRPNGRGTLYRDSSIDGRNIVMYEGEWRNGRVHGRGDYYSDIFEDSEETNYNYGSRISKDSKDNSYILYSGGWQSGKPNGQGTSYHVASYHNRQDTYSPLGDAIESVLTGTQVDSGGYERNTQKYFGGVQHVSYEGEWHDGKRHGQGTWYYHCMNKLFKHVVDGIKRYDGQWRLGERFGHGTSYRVVNAKNGKVKVAHDGEWRGGLPGECKTGDCLTGFGTFHYYYNPAIETYSDAIQQKARYEGEWRNGTRHGQGTLYWANGRIAYEGEFRNGHPNGRGILYWRDNRKIAYEGEFRNGRASGVERVSRRARKWDDIISYDDGYFRLSWRSRR